MNSVSRHNVRDFPNPRGEEIYQRALEILQDQRQLSVERLTRELAIEFEKLTPEEVRSAVTRLLGNQKASMLFDGFIGVQEFKLDSK